MKNWKVSTKLIAVLMAPLVVLIGLAWVGINERRDQASEASRAEDLTELAAKGSALIHELQNETIFSAAYQASEGASVGEELTSARGNTDEAIDAFQEVLADFNPDQESEAFANAAETVSTRVDDLPTIRQAVDDNQMAVGNAIEQLSATSEAILILNQAVAGSADTPDLARALENYVEFSRSKESAADSAAYVAAMLERNPPVFYADTEPCADMGDECPEAIAFQDALQDEDDHHTIFDDRATAAQKSLLRNATSTEAVRDAEEILDDALLAIDSNDPLVKDPAVWLTAATDKLDALLSVERSLVTEIRDKAVDLRSEAQNELRIFLLVTIIAILVSVILALLVARATARPLQKLTVAANRLSTEQLPGLVEQLRNPDSEGTSGFAAQLAPIDINSRDEIGQLADAFNTIQQVTLEVAEEQASLLRKGIGDIFINLARRNQTLLDRQIEFIDQLEANEEDPDQLDNLFKLDHLATRMRRNAESLLVLAGAEPPRRRGRPVALADVVRVAIGEVEDFARISLLALDEAMVGGNVAVDLAHLLSELMENATHFSPPDTHVEVVGRIEADGAYMLTITDQGIGMSSEQLSEANHQLGSPPLVGLALSRSLGFIVIGRLAQRFEIKVELQSSPSGGIQALIRLPHEIVTDEQGQPLPIEEGAVAALEEPAAALEAGFEAELLDAEAEAEAEEIEAALEEPVEAALYGTADEDEYEIVEEIVEVDETDGELADDEEYEIVEEIVEIEEDEPEPELELEDVDLALDDDLEDEDAAPATLEEAMPEGDAFDRGLESLISGDTAPGPAEESPVTEPEAVVGAMEADAAVTAEVDVRPPVVPPPPGSDMTPAGLVKRTPKKRENTSVGSGPLRTAVTSQRPTGQTHRSPEEVRAMLSRYRGGLKRGRDTDDITDA